LAGGDGAQRVHAVAAPAGRCRGCGCCWARGGVMGWGMGGGHGALTDPTRLRDGPRAIGRRKRPQPRNRPCHTPLRRAGAHGRSIRCAAARSMRCVTRSAPPSPHARSKSGAPAACAQWAAPLWCGRWKVPRVACDRCDAWARGVCAEAADEGTGDRGCCSQPVSAWSVSCGLHVAVQGLAPPPLHAPSTPALRSSASGSAPRPFL
jgi:hypothetical protein